MISIIKEDLLQPNRVKKKPWMTNEILQLKGTWKMYIDQLFDDTRSDPPKITDNTGPYILVDETRAAIKSMKKGKSRDLME